MRIVVLFSAALVLAAACTFPEVDYADGGAGALGGSGGASSTSTSTSTSTSSSSSASTSGMCTAPIPCATEAMMCADAKNNDHTTCVAGCKANQPCIKSCDKAFQIALGQCAAACDSCSGCKPNNCHALVGL
jgi:hypothetical protein